MAKIKKQFRCKECSYVTTRWMGRCPACGEWDALDEEHSGGNTIAAKVRQVTRGPRAKITKLGEAKEETIERYSTSFPELDRVLGGGIVPGSVVLLGGDPGIGKSTVLLQASGRMIALGRSVIYVAGEESPAQIMLRAQRLDANCDELPIISDHQVETIIATLKDERPDIVIIDSVQTLQSAESESAPGSVSQLKAVTRMLTTVAKSEEIAMILVGHVTRSGSIAGPRVVEHLVDTVLYLEGEPSAPLRIVRGVKNRFGSTLEVGLFEMTSEGLKDGINLANMASPAGEKRSPGVAVGALLEGSRAFLVEVQALVSTAVYGPPRITSVGLDRGRVQMMAAILERHVGDSVGGTDLYVNIVGGLKLHDPSCDLALILALASSSRNKAIPGDIWVCGEVGLTGELRPVSGIELRVGEAIRSGYKRIIIPARSGKLTPPPAGVKVQQVGRLTSAVALVFE